MSTTDSLSHTKWDCKYHIVWVPKGRRKAIFGRIRSKLGEIFHQLSAQKECVIVEGHLCTDHVHILIRIPPKYSVSQVVGFLKGKSAIMIAREIAGRDRNFTGQVFWARGYFVSTVGINEETIRRYIRYQEEADRKEDGPRLFN
ncbi:MAG: IS200/IS605 family transposase [Thermoguttaceae bacterium]